MNLNQRLEQHFEASLKAKQDTLDAGLDALAAAARACVARLQAGGKIMICGNGGSAADAQHFSAELLNRFVRERRPLASVALTTDSSTLTAVANDYSYEEVFSKQVEGLGRPEDLLIGISTSGNSPNVIRAIEAARERGIAVITLTGKDGGRIAREARPGEIELRVPHAETARIQEVHIVFLHCLCDAIDEILFGELDAG